jgi:hypothetical protein
VNKLSESVSRDALVVQQGLGKMQHVAVVAKSDLQGFITRAEGSAAEVSSLLDSKQCSMENVLQAWYVVLNLVDRDANAVLSGWRH